MLSDGGVKTCCSLGSNPRPACCEHLVLTTLPYAGTAPTVCELVNPQTSTGQKETWSHVTLEVMQDNNVIIPLLNLTHRLQSSTALLCFCFLHFTLMGKIVRMGCCRKKRTKESHSGTTCVLSAALDWCYTAPEYLKRWQRLVFTAYFLPIFSHFGSSQ